MTATTTNWRLRPIIYVRGFAGTENEIEDTVAHSYMGFNLGATKSRQEYQGNVRRHYFESPLVRLVKDFHYRDVYSDGAHMPIDQHLCPRPIIVYRYYDGQFYDELDEDEDELPPIRPKSKGDDEELVYGKRREIEDFSEGLAKLILKVRKRYLASADISKEAKQDFSVYLVGYSMGGLIIRSFFCSTSVMAEVVCETGTQQPGQSVSKRQKDWVTRFSPTPRLTTVSSSKSWVTSPLFFPLGCQ